MAKVPMVGRKNKLGEKGSGIVKFRANIQDLSFVDCFYCLAQFMVAAITSK